MTDHRHVYKSDYLWQQESPGPPWIAAAVLLGAVATISAAIGFALGVWW